MYRLAPSPLLPYPPQVCNKTEAARSVNRIGGQAQGASAPVARLQHLHLPYSSGPKHSVPICPLKYLHAPPPHTHSVHATGVQQDGGGKVCEPQSGGRRRLPQHLWASRRPPGGVRPLLRSAVHSDGAAGPA